MSMPTPVPTPAPASSSPSVVTAILALFGEIKSIAIGVLIGLLLAVNHIPPPVPGPGVSPPPGPGPVSPPVVTPAPPLPVKPAPPVVATKPAPPLPTSTVSGPMFAVAVYDETKLASYPQSQQDLFKSSTIAATLLANKTYWTPMDVKDERLSTWKDDVTAVGTPAMIWLQGSDAVYSTPAPNSEVDVVALDRKLRGQ